MKTGAETQTRPPQHQNRQPGIEHEMVPRPEYVRADYHASGKLQGKVAIITGGDSGIGRAIAIAFALEGADIAIQFLDEVVDANETRDLVEERGAQCLLFAGDLSDISFCDRLVAETVKEYGHLDILVNNAAEQFPAESVEELDFDNLESTFRVNCFSMFYLTKAALPYLKKGSSIINTASVTAYRGSPHLLDYSATKGAIVAFTRSLSKQLIKQGIYVNAVAPGPVWTPLIAATFPPDEVADFGTDVPMGRAAQPSEIAPCYVFLASDDTSYMSGQVLHPNGGEIING
jgi:NAD(P)-dependent dehydrogenase (short-subunit alcohol dehydrogenase family)